MTPFLDGLLANTEQPLGLEAEMLLRAARVRLRDEDARRLRALAGQGLDWDRALRLAADHRLTPLLARHLEAVDAERPESVRALLDASTASTVGTSLLQTSELVRVVRLLERGGVPVLTFKGPTLALDAYGDLGVRPFGDLDLLVPRSVFARAKEILLASGFSPRTEMTPGEETEADDGQFAYGLVAMRGTFPLAVEVHWALTHRAFGYDPSPDGLFARAVERPVAGARVRVPSPEDLLVFLCAHGAKHHWAQLLLVCDVAGFLEAHPDLDWDATFARARATGAERMLGLGLALARDVLGAALPAPASAAASTERVRSLVGQVAPRLWAPLTLQLPLMDAARFHVGVRDRASDRIAQALHHARLALGPSDKDREFFRLPSFLWPGYAVVRPLRLAVGGARRVLKSRQD